MSERILALEDALRSLQSQMSTDEHPLLRQELLAIKKSPELFGVDHHQPPVPARGPDNQRRDEEPQRAASSNSSREGTDEVGLVTILTSPSDVQRSGVWFLQVRHQSPERTRDLVPRPTWPALAVHFLLPCLCPMNSTQTCVKGFGTCSPHVPKHNVYAIWRESTHFGSESPQPPHFSPFTFICLTNLYCSDTIPMPAKHSFLISYTAFIQRHYQNCFLTALVCF